LQLPTFFLEALKSGKVTLSQNDIAHLEVKAQDNRIEINASDKQLVKEIISGALEANTKAGIREQAEKTTSAIKELIEMRPIIREIINDLCKQSVTITLSYKGDKLATIGSEANSTVTHLVTGTKGIEINSPIKLAELII
jgi:hypothetical protein